MPETETTHPSALTAEADTEVAGNPTVRITNGIKFDPDAALDHISRLVETRIVNIDAKVFEGRPRTHLWQANKRQHYTSARQFFASPQVRSRIREQVKNTDLKETLGRLQESFSDEPYPDEQRSGSQSAFHTNDLSLPGFFGPGSRQMTLFDVLDAQRKCLAGDTPVPLLDGTCPTIAELAARGTAAEFWVYACVNGEVVPALARSARLSGHKRTVEVVLDSGESIRCTHDHPFMLRDGSFAEAGSLTAGQSLMPLYRRLSRLAGGKRPAYEMVRHPRLAMWEPTHRMVARNVYPDRFFQGDGRDHTDHINANRADNSPGNLQVMTPVEHMRKTGYENARKTRVRVTGTTRSAETRAKMSEANRRHWQDPDIRAKRIAGMRANAVPPATPEHRAAISAGNLRAWAPGGSRRPVAEEQVANNHKVVEVREAGVCDVYDLTVPGVENFAVGQGVFVHNCFEAATRNPIGKRVCKIIPQFVLARGVKGTHTDPAYQKAWNEFTKSQGMSMRIKTVLRELVIYGEVFMRYFNLPDGLAVRSLDPSTIWEIVTNPDDIEEVYYYHQQYVTLHQNIVASPLNGKNVLPASTLVIRQVPGSDIDHFKINATSHEKRGRSELYAILAWLVRFRDFVNDRVVLNKMRAMFALDVAVDGGALDLAAAEQQFATPPGSGSVLIHNKKVEVEFKNANTNANESKTDSEMILKIIAVGAGVSEQFLGVSYSTNRAGALIQTEPDVKNFEDYREITEAILSKAADRVAKSKRLPATDVGMEFTFPSIASEDRSAKVKDIALAEAMDYFSKARAASMVAREFDVTNFDHEQEQAQIRSERADDPVMATGYQQVEKVAPGQMEMQQQAADAAVEQTKVAGEAKAAGMASAGKPGPAAKTKGGGKKPVKYTGAQGGVRSDKGGRGLPATKAALGRSKFSRGGEKTAIKNNRTSKTPILHEVDVREANTASTEVVFTRSGFSDKARTASIIERKRRRAARLMRMAEAAQTEADRAEAALKEQA
jgi:hypothetical protein